jgi:hypothetical protein
MPTKLVRLSDVRNSLVGFAIPMLFLVVFAHGFPESKGLFAAEILMVVIGLGSLYVDLEKKSHSARIF